jgi:hypothetical protein
MRAEYLLGGKGGAQELRHVSGLMHRVLQWFVRLPLPVTPTSYRLQQKELVSRLAGDTVVHWRQQWKKPAKPS